MADWSEWAPLDAAPWWLPGGNAQTIGAALWARPASQGLAAPQRERWVTPDGDFVDVDRWSAEAGTGLEGRPLLVLFHGLEGSSGSHYALAFAATARKRGWDFAVPHFRGCSGELNLAPRAYHSGDHEEIDWVLRRFRAALPVQHPVVAVGVSLGGNALLRWAAEQGGQAGAVVSAVASVCAPIDLAAAGACIDHGFNRWVYARMFLRTMVRKAEAKWRQFPGLFDREAVRRARTLYAFDNAFTAPLHGFRDTEDYWRRAAAKPRLSEIAVPALVLNALNDPFVPAASLPQGQHVGRCVTLWQPRHGGHVGFAAADGGGWGLPGHLQNMPVAVSGWLAQQVGHGHG